MKWRPNATQRAAYAEKMKEQDSMSFISSNGAIREGCILSWVDKSSGIELKGEVVNSSYGKKTNQHTFTIKTFNNDKILIKGRNLYDRLTSHIAGKISKTIV